MKDGSGIKQVNGEPGELETLASGKVIAKRNGYVYVYTSNESTQDVLFDNLGVIQITGPVLEETHYYPFGLTMSAISTVAPLKLEGKRKFNGIEFNHKEFSDGSGLELYASRFRELDPQIGRWWQIDPKPNYAMSPYGAMGLNPILNSDFLGDTIIANTNGRILDNTGGNDNFIQTANPLPAVTITSQKATSHLSPSTALFTSYETPDDKARRAFIDFYKDVDFSHGQLLPARSPIWDFFGYRQALNGLYVDADGFPLPPDLQAIQRQAAADIASLSMFGGPAESLEALSLLKNVAGSEAASVLSKGDLLRIENAATRINKPISVVGSRAKGTAGAYSDWDYVIEGLNNSSWKKIKNSLPGSKSVLDNIPGNIDIFKTLDPTMPHITIYPQ